MDFIYYLKKDKLSIFFTFTFIANFMMLCFYAFVTFENYFHTDAATKMLLANEILETGKLLPSGWNYVNNDIWIFILHILLVPLIKLFGLNYFTYSLHSVIYFIIYLYSVIYFLKVLNISLSSKLLFLNISLLSISYFYAAFNFGEIAYITLLIYLFLSLGLFLRVIDSKRSQTNSIFLLSLLLFIFVIHNPQRALIYYFAPLLISGIVLYLSNLIEKKKLLKLISFLIVSFLVGTILYYFLLQEVIVVKGANNLLFASYDRVLSNISIFFKGLFYTFGLVDKNQFSPFSLDGIVRILNFMFFILIIIAIYKIFNMKSSKERVLIISYFTYYILAITFLYIFTLPLAQDESTFRYFYQIVILCFLILVLYIDKLSTIAKTTISLFLIIYILISNYTIYVKLYSKNNHNVHKELSNYLVKNNLSYGFASYWHSYINNVFSDNKVKVYPIYLHSFVPFRWLSSNNWYTQYEYNRSFVVFTESEFKNYSNDIFSKVQPTKIETIDNFTIAIFDKNIAYKLNRVYKSSLEEGIDFTKEGYPDFIKSHYGFSGYESEYRWSEGKTSILEFQDDFKKNFILRFSGRTFKPSVNSEMRVKLGNQEKRVLLKSGYKNYALNFKKSKAKKIIFNYENPKSPLELGMSQDSRKLSFAFEKIIME